MKLTGSIPFWLALSITTPSVGMWAAPINPVDESESSGPIRDSVEVSFDSVEMFFEFQDALARGIEPATEQWGQLFATIGYKGLLRNMGRPSVLTDRMKLAYLPAKEKEREAKLQSDDFATRSLEHVIEAAKRRGDFDAFRKSFAAEDVLTRTRPLLAPYLPDEGVDIPIPRIDFVVFGPDAYASNEQIVVDVFLAIDMGDDRLFQFFAHELHHVYVGHLTRLDMPPKDHPDTLVVRAIRQLQLEGIADLIDKRHLLAPDARPTDWYGQKYRDSFVDSPRILSEVDALLGSLFESDEKTREIGKMLQSLLPFGCHPQGAFMANLIANEIGLEALVDTLEDPFEFLELFNQAATGTERVTPFSEATMELLEVLRERYVRPSDEK